MQVLKKDNRFLLIPETGAEQDVVELVAAGKATIEPAKAGDQAALIITLHV